VAAAFAEPGQNQLDGIGIDPGSTIRRHHVTLTSDPRGAGRAPLLVGSAGHSPAPVKWRPEPGPGSAGRRGPVGADVGRVTGSGTESRRGVALGGGGARPDFGPAFGSLASPRWPPKACLSRSPPFAWNFGSSRAFQGAAPSIRADRRPRIRPSTREAALRCHRGAIPWLIDTAVEGSFSVAIPELS
jgi:hypothetical protein